MCIHLYLLLEMLSGSGGYLLITFIIIAFVYSRTTSEALVETISSSRGHWITKCHWCSVTIYAVSTKVS